MFRSFPTGSSLLFKASGKNALQFSRTSCIRFGIPWTCLGLRLATFSVRQYHVKFTSLKKISTRVNNDNNPNSQFSLRPLMHLVCLPKFYITIVTNFSWVLYSSLEEWKIYAFFLEGAGGWVGGKQGGLCTRLKWLHIWNSKCNSQSLRERQKENTS